MDLLTRVEECLRGVNDQPMSNCAVIFIDEDGSIKQFRVRYNGSRSFFVEEISAHVMPTIVLRGENGLIKPICSGKHGSYKGPHEV